MRKGTWTMSGRSRPEYWARIILAIVSVAAAAACGSTGGRSASAPDRDATVVWGKPAEADVLDPVKAGSAPAKQLLNVVYENLVGLGDNLNVVPELAESWKQTSPKTYLFTLRKGVKFSNGRDMTVDDVVGSLNRMLDPKNASLWPAQLGISRVEPSGNSQVRITLTAPRTSFLAALAGTQAAILPMKELNSGSFDPKKELLGTGPFKVAAHTQGESWEFVRNPSYWRPGIPKFQKMTVRILPDDAARLAALRQGGVDVTTFDSTDAVKLLKGTKNVSTIVQGTTDYYAMTVNAKTSIFRDDRLREALALSIDRGQVKDAALGGVGRATGAVPVAFGGVCDPAALPFGRPDVGRARALVSSAGASGKTVDIITSAAVSQMSSPIAQVIQRNLRAAGLNARIVPVEVGDLVQRQSKADFDIILGWIAGYADPAMVLAWWSPERAAFIKPWSKPDTQLNALIDKSLATPPGGDRAKAMRDACVRIARNVNMVPLVSKDAIIAYRTDKLSAHIGPLEGYAVPLRRIAEFTAK